MKKKVFFRIVVVPGTVAIATVNVNLDSHNDLSSIISNNIEALSTENDFPSGAGIATQSECQQSGGYWGMALICDGGGANNFQCEIEGEITVAGVTVKDSYKKGKGYNLVWERWSCTTSSGNCCIASSQGVRIK